jgi:hypothetical protein
MMDLQRFQSAFKIFVATYLVVWGWLVISA